MTLIEENQYLKNKNISLETKSNELIKVLMNKLTISNTNSTANSHNTVSVNTVSDIQKHSEISEYSFQTNTTAAQQEILLNPVSNSLSNVNTLELISLLSIDHDDNDQVNDEYNKNNISTMNNFDLSTINFSLISNSLGEQDAYYLNTPIKDINYNDLNQ